MYTISNAVVCALKTRELTVFNDCVAQWIAHLTSNQGVVGSSPIAVDLVRVGAPADEQFALGWVHPPNCGGWPTEAPCCFFF